MHMLGEPDGSPLTSGLRRGRFKSSYSTGACTCVEVEFDNVRKVVRITDSKYLLNPDNDPATQPQVEIPFEPWASMLKRIEEDEVVDITDVLKVSVSTEGSVTLSCRRTDVELVYNASEWSAFVRGVVAGEFGSFAKVASSSFR
jgi:hypothetical protein